MLIGKTKIIFNSIDLTLIAFGIMNLFVGCSISLFNPFFPPLATRVIGLSEVEVSWTISINPIGGFFVGLLFCPYIPKYGRKLVMIISLIVLIICIFGSGLLILIRQYETLVFIMALLIRLLQGISRISYM